MTFLTRHLKQKATLWTVSSIDTFGDPSFNTPTTINVRWEERTELFINRDGREEKAQAIIFMADDANVGDYIYLGELTTADPTTVAGAHIVKDFRKIPGLGGAKFERRAMI